jgi:hypothetical protein
MGLGPGPFNLSRCRRDRAPRLRCRRGGTRGPTICARFGVAGRCRGAECDRGLTSKSMSEVVNRTVSRTRAGIVVSLDRPVGRQILCRVLKNESEENSGAGGTFTAEYLVR